MPDKKKQAPNLEVIFEAWEVLADAATTYANDSAEANARDLRDVALNFAALVNAL